MRGYFSLVFILLVYIFYIATAYEHNENETRHDDIDVTIAQTFPPNLRLTVETENKTSKTLTDPSGQDGEISQGRTFGFKRLQLMLLPVMYKMGVMTTLLAVLLIVSLKSLLIGVILLVVKVGSFLAKFSHSEPHHQTSWSPPVQPWPALPQPIHLHISHSGDGYHAHHVQDQVYSGWDRSPQSDPYGSPIAIDHGQYYFKG